jgi:hypothetical protein
MTARAFLVRGLLAGLLAGFATFAVAYTVGEPHVQTAINLEESHEAAESAGEGHHHDESGTVVSRHDQRTWGLLTGSLAVGIALGGIVALISAGVVGRLGRLTPGQSTAVIALIGFVAFALVPWLKYPATPPAVGNAETIGSRTNEYFAFVLISVVVAIGSSVLAMRVWRRWGAYAAVVAGAAFYLVVMVVAGQVMPTVNELGDFPADTLWYFRRASVITLATMWAVIGIVIVGLVGRLHRETASTVARRELAASL